MTDLTKQAFEAMGLMPKAMSEEDWKAFTEICAKVFPATAPEEIVADYSAVAELFLTIRRRTQSEYEERIKGLEQAVEAALDEHEATRILKVRIEELKAKCAAEYERGKGEGEEQSRGQLTWAYAAIDSLRAELRRRIKGEKT